MDYTDLGFWSHDNDILLIRCYQLGEISSVKSISKFNPIINTAWVSYGFPRLLFLCFYEFFNFAFNFAYAPQLGNNLTIWASNSDTGGGIQSFLNIYMLFTLILVSQNN